MQSGMNVLNDHGPTTRSGSFCSSMRLRHAVRAEKRMAVGADSDSTLGGIRSHRRLGAQRPELSVKGTNAAADSKDRWYGNGRGFKQPRPHCAKTVPLCGRRSLRAEVRALPPLLPQVMTFL